MPKQVDKDLFRKLLVFYDEDVIEGAGMRIRRMAKAADELMPTQRIMRIAEIFNCFRTRLPEWQERHMESLIREYAALLAGSDKASDKFWALEKRIRDDQQHVGVVARMSRSNMYTNLLALLQDDVITLDDLDGFSDDLRERFAFVMRDR